MTNTSWGTKRNCPSCNTHFYDLNKLPAHCPKCNHEFDPTAIVRAKRKAVRREAPEAKEVIPVTVLAQKKAVPRKKDTKAEADGVGEGGIGDIAEMEDVDDIENLQELSELEEMEEPVVAGDDVDEEAIIEDLGTRGKALVGNVEEEEASVLVKEIEDEEQESDAGKKNKLKKKPK